MAKHFHGGRGRVNLQRSNLSLTVQEVLKQRGLLPAKRSKYGATKVQVDGHTFDSKAEAKRWADLKLLERDGQIGDLRRQVRFELLPAMKWSGGTMRAKYYLADFTYTKRGSSRTTVEDVKGHRTREYVLKRHLLLLKYPDIEFHEVEA